MKLPIIYFSSSGNTKYFCEIIAKGINSKNIDTEVIPLHKIGNYPKIIENSEIFGIGSPVYGMNFTPNIINWIKSIPKTNEKKRFFLIDTNAGFPGAALLQAKKILEKKGYIFLGGIETTVPTRDSVFWIDYFDKLSWNINKLKRAFYFGQKIAHIFKKKINHPIKEYRIMPLTIIFSFSFPFIEREFYKLFIKFMVYNPSKCKKCKLCERLCPAGAINVQKRTFFDSSKCFLCFQCMRNCPEGALFLKIYPKAKFFKGPFQIKGYIEPDKINF
ncbi:MAG: EFR1 family ferrodoxin [Candidatus Helarchaeota archaeon]